MSVEYKRDRNHLTELFSQHRCTTNRVPAPDQVCQVKQPTVSDAPVAFWQINAHLAQPELGHLQAKTLAAGRPQADTEFSG